MRVTRVIWYAGTMLTALAMLAASATAAAQPPPRTVHARTGGPAAAGGAAADSSAAERKRAVSLKGFRGIAARLNTTPEALANAYEHASLANPKLSRGNFVAANVLADNLGAKHPNITTPAILSGLQSGKSLGQTLQSLGLSASEAKQARRTADRQAKDADKRVKDADKRAKAEDDKDKGAKHKSKSVASEKKPYSR
jgi:hypothetical protein